MFSWNEPTGTLGGIVAQARTRARALESRRSYFEKHIEGLAATTAFSAALRGANVAVIAEIKRMSPSKGAIAPGLDGIAQANAYQDGGAAAISVLTEPDHFGGSNDDLVNVRRDVRIPALKKDFHVAPIQLLEAHALGASAALLIVRALSPSDLELMMNTARGLSLEVLVEVRDEEELARALNAGAEMIGVNNRNLETLVIDRSTAERVIPLIPASLIAVAESGVISKADVERYAQVGADAVLVGSSISASLDPLAATRALTHVRRLSRAN